MQGSSKTIIPASQQTSVRFKQSPSTGLDRVRYSTSKQAMSEPARYSPASCLNKIEAAVRQPAATAISPRHLPGASALKKSPTAARDAAIPCHTANGANQKYGNPSTAAGAAAKADPARPSR